MRVTNMNKTTNLLSSARHTLVNNATIVRYGLIYVLFIFVFAFIYNYCLSGKFYHSTVPHEDAVRLNREQLQSEIAHQIIHTFKETHNSDELQLSNGWTVNANSFSVRALEVKDKEFSFQLDMEVTNLSQADRSIFIAPIISSPLVDWSENISLSESENSDNTLVYRPVTMTNPGLRSDDPIARRFAKILFPASAPKVDLWSEILGRDNIQETEGKIVIPLPKKLNTKILNLAKASEGNPSVLDGNIWRMLYLSATTITTLGYGDIIPLNTAARVATSTEAVLGIIIIGMFLNSISPKSRKKSIGTRNDVELNSTPVDEPIDAQAE